MGILYFKTPNKPDLNTSSTFRLPSACPRPDPEQKKHEEVTECRRCWTRRPAVPPGSQEPIVLCKILITETPDLTWAFSFSTSPGRRAQSGNKSRERPHCALLYSLPVEGMLAWQHSQLVFHFEVLETHGARLLWEGQTGHSETGRHLMRLLCIIEACLFLWVEITSLPHEDSTFLDLLLKPPAGVTKSKMCWREIFKLLRVRNIKVNFYLSVSKPLTLGLVS